MDDYPLVSKLEAQIESLAEQPVELDAAAGIDWWMPAITMSSPSITFQSKLRVYVVLVFVLEYVYKQAKGMRLLPCGNAPKLYFSAPKYMFRAHMWAPLSWDTSIAKSCSGQMQVQVLISPRQSCHQWSSGPWLSQFLPCSISIISWLSEPPRGPKQSKMMNHVVSGPERTLTKEQPWLLLEAVHGCKKVTWSNAAGRAFEDEDADDDIILGWDMYRGWICGKLAGDADTICHVHFLEYSAVSEVFLLHWKFRGNILNYE